MCCIITYSRSVTEVLISCPYRYLWDQPSNNFITNTGLIVTFLFGKMKMSRKELSVIDTIDGSSCHEGKRSCWHLVESITNELLECNCCIVSYNNGFLHIFYSIVLSIMGCWPFSVILDDGILASSCVKNLLLHIIVIKKKV